MATTAGQGAKTYGKVGDDLIAIEGASRYYYIGQENEVRAVDRVTWKIPRGRFLALRGRSGSGKTTLLNLIGGLDQATEGRLSFEGRDMTAMGDRELTELRRHEMGFIFQTFSLLPVLSAFENVELSMRIAGLGGRARRERARELLELVGLGERMTHRPFELSGGEQQRVAIARALANEPSLLIADEPTGALDSVTGMEIMMLFRRITDEGGISIAMATHDPALSQFTDDTLLMEDGRLSRAEGPLDFDLPDLVQHIEFDHGLHGDEDLDENGEPVEGATAEDAGEAEAVEPAADATGDDEPPTPANDSEFRPPTQ
jgi:putative ABC transport system ATP-binding protein